LLAGHAYAGGLGHDNRSGLIFALGGFAMLSCGDAVVKSMAGLWSPPALAALRYAIGAAVLGLLLLWREGRGGFAMPQPWAQLWRGAAVSLATVSFFAALRFLPMPVATALTFTSPMLTALLSAPLLGEPVRRETWIASIVAFAGVLVVLRPNLAEAGWAVLFPLVTALGMALLMIGNRFVAGKASPLAMQLYVAVMAAPILLTFAALFHLAGPEAGGPGWPSLRVVLSCATVALFASTAHWLIYLGTTRAGAASVAPMTYIQLLFAVLFGWLWFEGHPDLLTLLGAMVIVGSGLYLWRAGSVRAAGIAD
jgi:drug/metabolite transporter (DMT)-like permease